MGIEEDDRQVEKTKPICTIREKKTERSLAKNMDAPNSMWPSQSSLLSCIRKVDFNQRPIAHTALLAAGEATLRFRAPAEATNSLSRVAIFYRSAFAPNRPTPHRDQMCTKHRVPAALLLSDIASDFDPSLVSGAGSNV